MSLLSDIATAIKTKLGGTSINNTIPRYDGITCSLKSSGVTISDTNVVTAGGGFVGNLTGTASNATLAASATKLATARTIGGVSFDGAANINLPGVNTDGNQNTTGNAATATTLVGNETNWASNRTRAVANMLGWNRYGNGSVIFDASNGLSPSGSVVDKDNSVATWTSICPTLMGWDGTKTYGVRVDTARYAESVKDGVYTTGNQTIAGVKTFNSSPIVPTPTTETQATNKKYVDDSISSVSVGKVLQVIQTVKTDLFLTSSTSFVDITGLSASITPKSTSSKILVDVAINSNITSSGHRSDFRLVRNSTPIGLGTGGTNRKKATFVQDSYSTGDLAGRASSAKYLDSPSTISKTTYKLECSTTGGTLIINYTGNGEDTTLLASTICTITLTEIGV